MTRFRFAPLLVSTLLSPAAFAQDPATQSAPASTPTAAPDVMTPAAPAATTPPGTSVGANVPTAVANWLGHINAGYNGDWFYLRSDDDNFILMPSGRFQFDWLGYQGSGAKANASGGAGELDNQFFVRRVRLETFGTLMKHFDFQLGAEYAGTTTPFVSDAYVNVNYTNYANVQLGQFDAPFTMENRTSDKYTDLQERTTAVRGFAIPENKHIGGMVWGQPKAQWAYWSLGIFNGEGQNQQVHRYNGVDVMGRAWIAPFGLADIKLLKNVWIGGSLDSGYRNWSAANQLDRAAFTDDNRFTFFAPTYTGPTPAGGTAPGANNVHLGDDGALFKYAFELNAPIGPFVLKGEWIHLHEGMREVDTAAKTATYTPASARLGTLKGEAYYARLSYFVWGDPLINGLAGTQLPAHLFGVLKPNKTGDALQLLVQWEHMDWNYSAQGDVTSDKLVGNYGLNILTVGANYWLTKRVRVTADFLYNMYSGKALHPLTEPNSFEFSARIALAL